MTERKWTDTPWVACGGYTEFDTVEDTSGEVVAYDVASGDVAHLIAAAPDLYDALEYVRGFVSGDDLDIEYVNAALAKARGEAQ